MDILRAIGSTSMVQPAIPEVSVRRRPFGLGLHLRAAPAWRTPRRRTPFAAWEPLTRRERHPLVAAASVVLHAVAFLLLLVSRGQEAKNDAHSPQEQTREVRMMYLLPNEPASPKPRPSVQPRQREAPPAAPAFADPLPQPVTESPSPAKTEAYIPEHDEPAATSPTPVSHPAVKETAAEREEAAMVSEARRLFSPSSPTTATVAGPIRAGLPLPMMSGGPRCAGAGVEARPSDVPREGVIEGIVRTESGGRPIPGAFLQMLGTGSATFADTSGHYRLTFDPALVEACRSQLVRVTAPGFRARTMILTYGPTSDNVVDLASKR
jgi:hypothetical protein